MSYKNKDSLGNRREIGMKIALSTMSMIIFKNDIS